MEKIYLDLIVFIKKHWYHPLGIIVSSIFNLLIFKYVLPIEEYKWITFVFVEIILLLCWAYSKYFIPNFRTDEVGIFIATYANENLQEQISLLNRTLQNLLTDTRNDKTKIKTYVLPNHHQINTFNDAKKLLLNKNCCLIIWGNYQEGQLNSKKVRGFSNFQLNFTYRTSEEIKTFHELDVDSVMNNRIWWCDTDNDFLGQNIVVNNIVEVSKYIVGTILILSGRIDEAKTYYEDLRLELMQKRAHLSGPNTVNPIIEKVRNKLVDCLMIECQKYYQTKIFCNGSLNINKNDLNHLKDKLSDLRKYSIRHDEESLMAIVEFLLGNISGSKRVLTHAIKMKRGNYNTYFSLGFLECFSSNTSEIIKRYRKAIRLCSGAMQSANFLHMVKYCEYFLKLYPEKIEFHLVLGIIQKEYGDMTIAREQFEIYLSNNAVNSIGKAFAEEQLRAMNHN